MFSFLQKLFGPKKGIVSGAQRIYYFALPYKLSIINLHYGLKQLKKEGLFQQLPKDMQNKWQKAVDNWSGLTITVNDLDRINDTIWTKIASSLKLKWEKK